MQDIAVTLLAAAALGWLALACRIPPLVGFLAAGFLLGALQVEAFPGLEALADIGVTLLLFTIGLKFDVRSLLRPEAYGTASIHMAFSVLIGMGTLGLLGVLGFIAGGEDWKTLMLVGFALSFSSTVLAVKVLEERSDDGSFYGQTAIAILVIQDIAAVAFMTITAGHAPSPWAFALALLLPASWVLRRALNHVGHGELLVLFGAAMALGPGYFAFDAVGLKGDLGALVMGLLFASHPRALEMSKSLFSVKELFLVGFFLAIGLTADPTWADVGLAALLCVVLLPFTLAGFVALGWVFGLRNRTAAKLGLVLTNFSEFSIIVAALGVESGMIEEDWLTIVAVAVALSMVVSSMVNGRGHHFASRIASWFREQDVHRLRLEDRPIDTSQADVVVLGMGRVGRSAYERIHADSNLRVLGIDNDHAVVSRLREEGYSVLEGDATDMEFWTRLCSGGFVQTVVLAMPIHDSNTFALDQLRQAGFEGRVAAMARHQDQVEHLAEEGVHGVFNLYEGAGVALADLALGPAKPPRLPRDS
ncbi:cation:proton antiporter family protein [Zhihengliuella salsuginis]|uniref:Potassium transporter Kef n=1 Tax=Zhihengliuella salsuginis TaxID=578222 RepID=A0ABQ3GIM0_9MICC|nr:cation:proton antiporter family protein [Zhihengliuella salsuginis]GHD06815.1 potassium transporter Kef [Zhihengliuella salsuginis]